MRIDACHKILTQLSRPDYSAFDAPAPIPVTRLTSQTVYSYAKEKLCLAYGLATLSAFISILIGSCAILTSGASYSNNFSTVLRIALAIELSVDVKESDMDGENPLPKYMASATVGMRSKTNAKRDEPLKELKC